MKKIGILLNTPLSKTMQNIMIGSMNGIIDGIGSNNVVVIDTNSSNKVKNLLKKDDVSFLHLTWKDNYNWLDYEEYVKENIKDIESLIVVACAYRDDKYDSNSHKLVDLFESHLNNDDYTCYTKFVSTRRMLQNYIIFKQFKNKKLIHYCVDPKECVSTDLLNTGICTYAFNKGNKVNAPAFEYYLFKNGKYADKTVDFTFYATALTSFRKYLVDYMDTLTSIRNSDVKIIYKLPGDGVTQNAYYDKLSRSKFTLVIPSYDVTTFSIGRFVESIAHHCIPLILDTVDLTDMKNTFPDMYDIITKYLVVSIDSIQEKIDSIDREAVLNIIMNCQTVKNWQDIEYYKQRWSYLINK